MSASIPSCVQWSPQVGRANPRTPLDSGKRVGGWLAAAPTCMSLNMASAPALVFAWSYKWMAFDQGQNTFLSWCSR
jgi:hypothetical protein